VFGALFSGVAFAKKHDVEYRHIPVKTMAHWVPEADGPYTQLESFMGLEPASSTEECTLIHHAPMLVDDYDTDYLREVYNKMDKTEWESADFVSGSGEDVVVHVRRGDDAVPGKLNKPQYVSDAEYLRGLDQVLCDILTVDRQPCPPPSAMADSDMLYADTKGAVTTMETASGDAAHIGESGTKAVATVKTAALESVHPQQEEPSMVSDAALATSFSDSEERILSSLSLPNSEKISSGATGFDEKEQAILDDLSVWRRLMQETGPPTPTADSSPEQLHGQADLKELGKERLKALLDTQKAMLSSPGLSLEEKRVAKDLAASVSTELRSRGTAGNTAADDAMTEAFHARPWHDKGKVAEVKGGATDVEMTRAGIRFHIFSEGIVSDFAAFEAWAEARKQYGVALNFKLNGDLREAFHALTKAGVMVFASSSFPQLAANFNVGGKKYYFPQRTCASPSWVSLGTTRTRTNKMKCHGEE
jgi:hypothetical protein